MAADVKRYRELDALRGLAAISVVLLHFVDMYFPYDLIARRTPAQRVLIALASPFYRGYEAVFLFFVLSGFVLALPYTRGVSQPYPTYLLRRVARIYLPYLAALGLAVLGASIWHGHLYLGEWAETSWTAPPDWPSIRDHVLFVGAYNWLLYNRVFWSLVVEMRVSLIFPLLAAAMTRIRLVYALASAGLCLATFRLLARALPRLTGDFATVAYVSVFIAGILLARHLRTIESWYEARNRPERWAIAGSVFAGYFFGHLLPHLSKLAILYGAVGAILLAINSETARKLLAHGVARFLGTISYSLYLIHLPILYALTFMLHTRMRYTLLFVLYLLLAVGCATIFHALVERPCIELGRRVGRRRPSTEAVPVGV